MLFFIAKDLQAIVTAAMRAANQDMLDEYTARNNAALEQLINKHNVQFVNSLLRSWQHSRAATMEVIAEQADENARRQKYGVLIRKFLEQVKEYHRISEQEYYLNR